MSAPPRNPYRLPVIHIEKYVKASASQTSGEELCATIGKPISLTFRYTGGGPDATDTHQQAGKYSVTGDPNDAPIVQILVTDNADAFRTGVKVFYPKSIVNLNGEFTATSALAGSSRFPAKTYIHIFDAAGTTLLQTVLYHTSCSAPIVLGDVTGGVTLTAVDGELGSASLPPAIPAGFGDDADMPPGPDIEAGDDVTWTYVVTNPGSVPLSNVVVVDDNETPGNPFDDYLPDPILNGGFNVGDLDQDNLLDPGEQWLYTATATVNVLGQHMNVGTVTGTSPGGQMVEDNDPSHYTGTLTPCPEGYSTIDADFNGTAIGGRHNDLVQ